MKHWTVFLLLLLTVRSLSAQKKHTDIKKLSDAKFEIVNKLIENKGLVTTAHIINSRSDILKCRKDIFLGQFDFISLVDSYGIVHASNDSRIPIGSLYEPRHYDDISGKYTGKKFIQYVKMSDTGISLKRNIGLYQDHNTEYGIYREWTKVIPGKRLFSQKIYLIVSIQESVKKGPKGRYRKKIRLLFNEKTDKMWNTAQRNYREENYREAYKDFMKLYWEDKRLYGKVVHRISLTLFFMGQYHEAMENGLYALTYDPENPYKYFILTALAGSESINHFKDVITLLRMRHDYFCRNMYHGFNQWSINDWAVALFDLLTGRKNFKYIKRKAGSDKKRLCEAYTYGGILLKMRKRKSKAREYFKKAVHTGITGSEEYRIARYYIDQMK